MLLLQDCETAGCGKVSCEEGSLYIQSWYFITDTVKKQSIFLKLTHAINSMPKFKNMKIMAFKEIVSEFGEEIKV